MKAAKKTIAVIALILLPVLASSGCNRLQSGTNSLESFMSLNLAPDTTRPLVSNTTPAFGATGIAFPATIIVVFTERMDPSTIDDTTFTLTNGGTTVTGTVSLVKRTATYTIGQPILPLTTYTATVTTGCADMAGNTLLADYSWTFTTGPGPDVTAPGVDSTSPADLDVNVAVDVTIQINFSEAIDPATVSDSSFIIEEAGIPIAGTSVVPSGSSVTIDPAADLNPTTTYTVTVTTAVMDLAGNPLTSDYVFTFTTGTGTDMTPPNVSSTNPPDLDTNVSVTTTVTVSFDEDMISGTVNTASFTLYNGPLPVVGTVSYIGPGADYEFTPNLPLFPGTTYTATVTTAATDLAGNGLAADYVWTFATGLIPSNLAQGLSFNDNDRGEDLVGGTVTIMCAADESDLTSYVVYWGSDATTKLPGAIIELPKTGSDIQFLITNATPVPVGATHMLVYSKNIFGESLSPMALDFDDMISRMIEINTLNNTGSSPSNFAEYNGLLYFSATDVTYGYELWSFDDSSETLNLAASVNPGGDSLPTDLIVYNGLLYFAADNGTIGRELWSYDDSPAALTCVQDYYPGAAGSDPKFPIVYNYAGPDYLYFQANDGSGGFELYEYDSAAPPAAYYDINGTGTVDSRPAYMTALGADFYFQANDGLGTGEELWIYDTGGTPSRLTDANPGINNFSPAYLYPFQGNLVFQANDGTSGIEFWQYVPGTGESLVADIAPGGLHSSPYGFHEYDNKLYFSADDNTNGYELWVYDPPAAPAMVSLNASGNAYPNSFVSYNGDLYFSASNGVNGQELWVYDGTTPITVGTNMRQACEINNADSSYVSNLVVYNGRLYFNANDGANGPELWVYYLK